MQKLTELLEKDHVFPSDYTFKFVSPSEHTSEIKSILSTCQLTERPSKTGKYNSVTAVKRVHSATEIVQVYESVRHINGLISL